MVNLQEAFSKLNMIESSEFDLLDPEEKDAMKNFLDDDAVEAEDVDIIDPQAEDESELEDSYIGKIIVQCPVCRSLIYKTQEELNEMGDEPQTCPYCFSVENFDIIGKIAPIEDEMAPEAVEEAPEADEAPAAEPVVEVEDKPLEECGDAPLQEDLENVTIETEDQVINVSAEDKVEECPECEAAAEIPVEEPAAEEHEDAEVIAPLEDDIPDEPMEDEVDEIDEESFDEFAESLLKDKYSNIVSYKTSKMKDCGNHVIAEGVVTLKNGDKKLTEFRIRPSRFSKEGKGTCLVENLQLNAKKIARTYVNK